MQPVRFGEPDLFVPSFRPRPTIVVGKPQAIARFPIVISQRIGHHQIVIPPQSRDQWSRNPMGNPHQQHRITAKISAAILATTGRTICRLPPLITKPLDPKAGDKIG